nr:reverse transcriptase domain-containing protein [Tanacetum cinerariifolium]
MIRNFEVGDFVWDVLTKDHFLVGEYNKLSAKKIGPLEIIEKVNSNAYRLKLPSHIQCSDVFNVKHLLPYHGNSSDEDSVGNSRMNFVYPGGNDVNPSIGERANLFLEAQDRHLASLVHGSISCSGFPDKELLNRNFEVGDFVWDVLTKDHFLVGEYNKLSAKKIGPLEIIEKVNSNAYRLKLPSHIQCSDVFIVKHLLPYHGNSSDEDSVGNSRTNFVYPGGNDVNPSIRERADLFLEAQDRMRKRGLLKWA